MVSIILVILISIHAPARGATSINPFFSSSTINFNPRSREGSDLNQPLFLFIHHKFQSTLPRGERRLIQITKRQTENFNPRSREGSDASVSVAATAVGISIHAPARGATELDCHIIMHEENFNPRSREGSDRKAITILSLLQKFQSTLPRGERHIESSSSLFS